MILDYCQNFSIADLKRLGYFVPDGVSCGVLSWNDSTSRISITVDNIAKRISLDYVIEDGRHMTYNVNIFEMESNIGKGVVRFFDCPMSHALCRKLYFNGDMFVSRKVICGAIYQSQAMSKWQRDMGNGWASADFVPVKPYGKTHYRGKLTPYGKRIRRYQGIADHCESMASRWSFEEFAS